MLLIQLLLAVVAVVAGVGQLLTLTHHTNELNLELLS